MDQNDTPDGRTLALSKLVERLIAFCNREDRKTKKEIFRVIRCHNCSQASTGGTKVGVRLALPPHQVLCRLAARVGAAALAYLGEPILL